MQVCCSTVCWLESLYAFSVNYWRKFVAAASFVVLKGQPVTHSCVNAFPFGM